MVNIPIYIFIFVILTFLLPLIKQTPIITWDVFFFLLYAYIFDKFIVHLAITLKNNLLTRFYNTSFFAVLNRFFFKFKNKFKPTNLDIVQFTNLSFRIKKITYRDGKKDFISFKLFEESEEIIKEINFLIKELRKKENINNFELINKIVVNLAKLNKINEKFEKHNKKL